MLSRSVWDTRKSKSTGSMTVSDHDCKLRAWCLVRNVTSLLRLIFVPGIDTTAICNKNDGSEVVVVLEGIQVPSANIFLT
jgi:hypothetical protein